MGISMRTPVCDLVDIEYPVLGFTHRREVVVAISRAGGMGMHGAAYFSPEQGNSVRVAQAVDGLELPSCVYEEPPSGRP